MVASLQRLDPAHEPSIAPGPSIERLDLAPGQVAGLDGVPGSGLTRLGLSLLAPHATHGHVAFVDVRGWMNPAVAWELGIPPDRLIVVRCDDLVAWGRVMAALVSGVRGVYAEVPRGVRDPVVRTVGARARTHRTPIVLRPLGGPLPGGVAQLHVEARAVDWVGVDAGHGHLRDRRLGVTASGKALRGMRRTIEIEDHGTHDVRLVPGVGAPATRRLA